jgi:hypothetical protein
MVLPSTKRGQIWPKMWLDQLLQTEIIIAQVGVERFFVAVSVRDKE